MSVAKTYEKYKIVKGPYERDKKMYVTILYPYKNNGEQEKEVRWYEEQLQFSQKKAFGFDRGDHITIFYGNEELIQQWREQLPEWSIWQNESFGYFMPAHNYIDELAPTGIQSRDIYWNEIRDPNDPTDQMLMPWEWINNYLNHLLYENTSSTYQGNIQEWLERDVTIVDCNKFESQFGSKNLYVMKDSENNEYVWTTNSKELELNSVVHMRMKVKAHQEYKGTKQTVVYYCRIK